MYEVPSRKESSAWHHREVFMENVNPTLVPRTSPPHAQGKVGLTPGRRPVHA